MKLNSNSYWLTSGVYSLLTKGLTVLFGFANFYILIRLLSRDDYGAWVLFISVCTVMELVKHGFIRNPLIRYLAITEKKDWGQLQTASLFLNSTIGLLQLVALLLFAFLLSKFWGVLQLKSLFFIYMITTIALIPTNHLEIIQQAEMKFKEIFYSCVLRHGLLFLYILLSLYYDSPISLDQLAFVQCACTIAGASLAFALNFKLLTLTKRLEKKWLMELFHYGKFTFGTNISSMVVKNIDTWMLGRMISTEAVTIFNPAIRVSNLVEVPTDTLSFIYFPHITKNIRSQTRDGKSVKYFYERAVASILAIMIPVVIIINLFSHQVIQFIAGRGFEDTAPILQVTMLFGLLIPFNRFLGITLDAIGKAAQNFRIVLITAGLNIISNIFFIGYYGIIGAAVGTLTTYGIMVTSNLFFLNREFGVSLFSIASQVVGFYRSLFFQFAYRIQSLWD